MNQPAIRPDTGGKASRAVAVFAAFAFIASATITSASADPANWERAGWKTDFSRTEVPFDEIIPGGPPKDGIPSIDEPAFVSAEDADRFSDREPVIEIVVDGLPPRAYPLSVLTWHEIVNDTIDGRPLAITYCPLCNSAVVFDRVIDGEPVEFGTTGLLRNSDLVMYDRATESWWQQFTGEAIVGHHAGDRLTMIPSRTVSFADFRERHPQGDVLVPNDWNMRNYGRNPYVGYDGRSTPYPLYTGALPANMEPMARVIVVRDDADVRTMVTLEHLRNEGEIVVDDTRLTWRAGVASVLDSASIADGREVGAIDVRNATDDAPLVHDITFAFVVQAFHPELPVLTGDGWVELEPDSH
ncbi:MAG: DUF3179 domain-containing protein [Salinarimonas sp.]|nr:DUF3179 domain-containing protein [Salinarimonas sp.]